MNEIIKKNAIKYGIITGIIALLITLIVYVIDYKLFTNIWLGLAIILTYLVIGIVQLSELRKNLGGFMSFKEGFTGYFLGALLGILISTAFTFVLFVVIDTETAALINDSLIEYQVQNLKNFNVPTEQIKQTVEYMKETPAYSSMGILKGLLNPIIGSIFFGLILAAIFKRKPKEQF